MKTWTRYAAVALLTVTYIAALWKIQGGHFGASGVSVLDNPLTLLPGGLRVLNALRIAWKYVALLLLPATLSCDYSYNQIPLYADVRHLLLPVTAALLLFAGWFCILARRKLPGYAIAGAIFFAGFAATSNLLTRTGTIFAERLAYLPSAGFCLIVALLLGRLERRHRLAALVLLSVLAVALGVRAVVRNQDWRDNATLYSAAARAVPNSAKMRAFRGAVYVGRNQFDLARADLQTALRIYPEFPDAIETLGLLETRAGNSAEALRLLKQAFDMSDRKDIDYDYRAVNLAALQLQLGKPTDALTLLNTLIAESPGYSRAWSNRAVARLQLGQLDAAREDARTALRLDPNNAQAFAVFHRADRPLP